MVNGCSTKSCTLTYGCLPPPPVHRKFGGFFSFSFIYTYLLCVCVGCAGSSKWLERPWTLMRLCTLVEFHSIKSIYFIEYLNSITEPSTILHIGFFMLLFQQKKMPITDMVVIGSNNKIYQIYFFKWFYCFLSTKMKIYTIYNGLTSTRTSCSSEPSSIFDIEIIQSCFDPSCLKYQLRWKIQSLSLLCVCVDFSRDNRNAILSAFPLDSFLLFFPSKKKKSINVIQWWQRRLR